MPQYMDHYFGVLIRPSGFALTLRSAMSLSQWRAAVGQAAHLPHGHMSIGFPAPQPFKITGRPGAMGQTSKQGIVMSEDERCCGTGTCIINADGVCWCGQKWDGEKMCFPQADRAPGDTQPAQDSGQQDPSA